MVHVSTVEQTIAIYPDRNLAERRLVTVCTDYDDWRNGTQFQEVDWEDLDDEDREWWTEFLDGVHDQYVRVAELRPAQRRFVEEDLQENFFNVEMEDLASYISALVEEAERDIDD